MLRNMMRAAPGARPALIAVSGLVAAVAVEAAPIKADLSTYQLAATYTLSTLPANRNEISAVTWNPVNNRLYMVEDEGSWIFEMSTTGQLISQMGMAGITNPDMEGLTYFGNGSQFVVTHERARDAWLFNYAGGTTLDFSTMPKVSLGAPITTNDGIEGISYDPVTQQFVFVKEKSLADPQNQISGTEVNTATVNFGAGTASVNSLFSGVQIAGLGIIDLADVQVLAPAGANPLDDRLLLLSHESQKLLEVTRGGEVLSFYDLTAFGTVVNGVTSTRIEGVAIDDAGNIYLTYEGVRRAQDADAWNPYPSDAKLIVLAPSPVPLPAGVWLMVSGLGALGLAGRRRLARKVAD